MGGLPVAHFFHFFVRGHPDSASLTIAWFDGLWCQSELFLGPICHWSKLYVPKLTDERLLDLIIDPYGLNLANIAAGENKIRNIVKKVFSSPRLITNERLRSLYQRNEDQAAKEFKQQIISVTPCRPRLLSEQFSSSVYGLQLQLQGRIATSRSKVKFVAEHF